MGLLGFLCRSLCCDLSWMCEPADTWNIEDECREGERGCGTLYKRGKSAGIWSKRYFVLSNLKLVYFTDRTRATEKGEIILPGATAKPSSTRANARHQYYFDICHPECGTREFYAKTNHRRQQWIDKINEISSLSSKYVTYGTLSKQGGMNKSTWQDRWFICRGKYLDYFENVTDSQPKGSIDLFNAKVREFSLKDKKFCFEIVAVNSKKGKKKYVFATANEEDRKRWMDAVIRASQPGADGALVAAMQSEMRTIEGKVNEVSNPLTQGGGATPDTGGPSASKTLLTSFTPSPPPSTPRASRIPSEEEPLPLQGVAEEVLHPQSPWRDPEQEANENMRPKGVIAIAEILPVEDAVRVQGDMEIILQMDGRTYNLKAYSFAEAKAWVESIKNWMEWYKNCP